MQKSDDTLWCLVCNTFLSSRTEANEHFTSNYHSERVKYLTFMKRSISQQSSETATDESKAKKKKIYEIYQTPYDYIQGQSKMSTEPNENFKNERLESGKLWKKDEFPGLPPTTSNDGSDSNSKKKRHRPNKRNRNKGPTEIIDQSSKTIDKADGPSRVTDKIDQNDNPPKKTSEMDKLPAVPSRPESVVSEDSVISSRPSIWGQNTHNYNAGTSDYWGSSSMDNRFQERSASYNNDDDSWSVGEHKQKSQGHSVGYDNDRWSLVEGKNHNQSLGKPRWFEQQKNESMGIGGDSCNNRWPEECRRHGVDSRGFDNGNHVQSTWSYLSPEQKMQPLQQMQQVQPAKELQKMQAVQQYQTVQKTQPIQTIQQMQQVQAVQQMQPVQTAQQMQQVQAVQQMQPLQQVPIVQQMQFNPQMKLMQQIKQVQHMQQVPQMQSMQQMMNVHQVQSSQPMPHMISAQQMQPLQPVKEIQPFQQQGMHQMQPIKQQMQPVQPMQQMHLMQPIGINNQMPPGQVMSASQMMQPMPNSIPLMHHMHSLPANPPVGAINVPSIGQMFREAGARSRQSSLLGDYCTKPPAFPPPSSSSRGWVQQSPRKNQQQESPRKGQQQEAPNKPPPKRILQNTYFGSDRPPIEIPDNVTSIYVRSPDAYDVPDEDLKKFFSVFGEVEAVRKPGKKKMKKTSFVRALPSIIVDFTNSTAVRAALKKTLFMGGKFTAVTPVLHQGPLFKNPKSEKAKASGDIYDLQEIGVPGLSFEESLDLFKGLMNLDPDLEAKQQAVCRDLEATYDHVLPGVQAKLFGSSQIGLRLKDSDTDIFMDCPSGQPPRNFVQKYGYLMFDNKLFENVVKIAFARVPIVTFNHVKTGLLCDVTFLNKLGLKNSQMLKFLLSLDRRIRDLALIVKYWAKVHELSGVGNYSNYALTVMVLFYLQQLDEPLVPSIYLLQQLAAKKEVCESWECSFCDDPNLLPKITNKSSTKDLLLGFFDFWATFDYAKYVACPLLGRKIDKSDFTNFNSLPEELARYKQHAMEVEAQLEASKQLENAVDKEKQQQQDKKSKYKNKQMHWYEKTHALNVEYPVCVQDSFDLSYNITRMIKLPLLARFQWLCEYARDEVLGKMTDKVLLNLFVPPIVKPPPQIVSQEFTRQKDVYINEFKIPGVDQQDKRYKHVWFMVVRLTIVYVLTHVYCIEVEMDDSNETKAINCCENLDFTDREFRTLCMKMKGHSCVFSMRNNMRKQLVRTDDEFINECVLTRAIHELKEKEAEKNGDKSGKSLGAFTIKLRFFCFPDEQRPRLMVQHMNCKSSNFNVVQEGLKGLFCTSFQRYINRLLAKNDLPLNEYMTSGGGDFNEFGLFFENFIKDCNEKSKAIGLSAHPKIVAPVYKPVGIKS